MLGNEGTGLSPKQMALCDTFVYIPQHGQGTASLNVNVAAAIVLHRFACWASLPEAPRTGFKYNVKQRPLRRAPRGTVPLTEEQREAERARRAALMEEEEDGSGVGAWCRERGDKVCSTLSTVCSTLGTVCGTLCSIYTCACAAYTHVHQSPC